MNYNEEIYFSKQRYYYDWKSIFLISLKKYILYYII